MKLTKGGNAKESTFYRDTINGRLIIEYNPNLSKTEEIADNLIFKTNTYVNRMISKPAKDEKTNNENRFYSN